MLQAATNDRICISTSVLDKTIAKAEFLLLLSQELRRKSSKKSIPMEVIADTFQSCNVSIEQLDHLIRVLNQLKVELRDATP